MRMRGILATAALAMLATLANTGPAAACSPPFNPTIEALGPEAVVIAGVTGERTATGRLFHVERVFNGDITTSPIVIAFKEGEPVGDCSYPVAAGTPLIIAPDREPDGTLSANLATLQADPRTDDGRRYMQEAIRLFGPGFVPTAAPAPADDGGDGGDGGMPVLFWVALAAVLLVGAAVPVLVVFARRTGDTPPA